MAEGARLESVFRGNSNVGSNPTLSASLNSRRISPFSELDWGSRPGNASFVPPLPTEMMDCLNRFEHFLHEDKHGLPLLVEAGLVHVQCISHRSVISEFMFSRML